ncbi:MAG: hypothetical protein KDK66_01225, partial [Deltaproteobacteria bacterium]|nr:hypothetical protein [Deltaproteobacteria bacterium]
IKDKSLRRAYFSTPLNLLKKLNAQDWQEFIKLLISQEAWPPLFNVIGLAQQASLGPAPQWSLEQARSLVYGGKVTKALTRLKADLVQSLDPLGQAKAYEALAVALFHSGKEQSILSSFKKAYQLFGQAKDYEGAVHVLITWGLWHLKQQGLSQAQPLFNKAAALLEKFKASFSLQIKYTLALARFYFEATDFDQAQACLDQVQNFLGKDLYPNFYLPWAVLKASLEREQERPSLAQETIKEALPWGYLGAQWDELWQAESLLASLSASEMGSSQAGELWSNALWAARSSQNQEGILKSLLHRARHALFFHRTQEALADLEEARNLAEETKHLLFWLEASLWEIRALRTQGISQGVLAKRFVPLETFWKKNPLKELSWLYYWELGELKRLGGEEKPAKQALTQAMGEMEAYAKTLRPFLRKLFLQDGKLEEIKSSLKWLEP